MTADLDVAVVGGGVAGLALAYRLQQAGRAVHVFERDGRVGGRMRTLRRNGYLIDEGAEMMSTHGYQATWRLLGELGVTSRDVPHVANPVALWRDGRAHPDVGRPRGLVTGAGLSPRARLDLLRFNLSAGLRARAFDPDRPERTPLGETTVAELAGRYTRELTDYLFEPLAGGFFGWRLDRCAAGPLVALLLATRSTSHWRTPRGGMGTLPRLLARRVEVSTGCGVREVVVAGGVARLTTDAETVTARSAVLCVPAPAALDLYPDAPADERGYLEACTYAPMLRVSCLLDRPVAVRGGGAPYVVLLPRAEDDVLAGFTLDHNKATDRVPRGGGLVSLLTRPRATADLLEAGDAEVVDTVVGRGERYLPGVVEALDATVVHRFRHGLPEARPAALRLRAGFLRRPVRPVDYAGDWLMLRPNSEGAVRSAEIARQRVMSRRAAVASRSGSPDATPGAGPVRPGVAETP